MPGDSPGARSPPSSILAEPPDLERDYLGAVPAGTKLSVVDATPELDLPCARRHEKTPVQREGHPVGVVMRGGSTPRTFPGSSRSSHALPAPSPRRVSPLRLLIVAMATQLPGPTISRKIRPNTFATWLPGPTISNCADEMPAGPCGPIGPTGPCGPPGPCAPVGPAGPTEPAATLRTGWTLRTRRALGADRTLRTGRSRQACCTLGPGRTYCSDNSWGPLDSLGPLRPPVASGTARRARALQGHDVRVARRPA